MMQNDLSRSAAGDVAGVPAPADVADSLRAVVDNAVAVLRAISDEQSARSERGGWSPRQTIGHLIDSAANNHTRFLRGQLEEDLYFPGYAQDSWVELQGYDEAPWEELIELWSAYNRHLVRVIERIDPLEWSRPRARHNFDEIGFTPIDPSRLGSLAWLVIDYVAHLRHHIDRLAMR